MIELLKAENNSAIINANIIDGAINAGLIIALPLSPNSLVPQTHKLSESTKGLSMGQAEFYQPAHL